MNKICIVDCFLDCHFISKLLSIDLTFYKVGDSPKLLYEKNKRLYLSDIEDDGDEFKVSVSEYVLFNLGYLDDQGELNYSKLIDFYTFTNRKLRDINVHGDDVYSEDSQLAALNKLLKNLNLFLVEFSQDTFSKDESEFNKYKDAFILGMESGKYSKIVEIDINHRQVSYCVSGSEYIEYLDYSQDYKGISVNNIMEVVSMDDLELVSNGVFVKKFKFEK